MSRRGKPCPPDEHDYEPTGRTFLTIVQPNTPMQGLKCSKCGCLAGVPANRLEEWKRQKEEADAAAQSDR